MLSLGNLETDSNWETSKKEPPRESIRPYSLGHISPAIAPPKKITAQEEFQMLS